MQKINNELVLRKDDYKLLVSYLNGRHGKTAFDRRNAEDLQTELKKAKLVNKDDFPEDVVRPDKADIKEKRISIMAPIGTALIGFRQGQKIKWQVPAGKRTFTILEVINEQ